MHKIDGASGQIIASETQASVAAIDNAVMAVARLCTSVVEVSAASNLPVVAGQPALAKLADSLSSAVEMRGQLAGAARDLLKVQGMSNLRETSFGCPNGLPPKTAVHRELMD